MQRAHAENNNAKEKELATMARTGFIHHIGSFLLLVATVLLIVTSISAPTVHNLSMLRIEIDGSVANRDNPVITLGTFGWCVQNTMA